VGAPIPPLARIIPQATSALEFADNEPAMAEFTVAFLVVTIVALLSLVLSIVSHSVVLVETAPVASSHAWVSATSPEPL
jgi:hypothetical protein